MPNGSARVCSTSMVLGRQLVVTKKVLNGCLGFLFFRLFDVVKIYPINKAQEAPGGYGVVLDDFVAGIFANIVLVLVTAVIKI